MDILSTPKITPNILSLSLGITRLFTNHEVQRDVAMVGPSGAWKSCEGRDALSHTLETTSTRSAMAVGNIRDFLSFSSQARRSYEVRSSVVRCTAVVAYTLSCKLEKSERH